MSKTKPLSEVALKAEIAILLDEGPSSESKLQALLEREHAVRAARFPDSISPPGKIPNLHPLLEERRHTHQIPDVAFSVQAAFDAIFVHQIDDNELETYGPASSIIRIAKNRERDQITSPRGVIVSAGARALECLLTNGMDLGHVVSTLQMAPFKREFADPVGYSLLMMRVGDVFGSEDTAAMIRSNRLSMGPVVTVEGELRVAFGDGKGCFPQHPWISADR
jgi:hypothetical protein